MLRWNGRKRRNLASAFAGEISAIVAVLEDRAEAEGATSDTAFVMPRCDLYKANAGQIDLFDAPLPSQLTHFYTRLAGLPEFLRNHGKTRATSDVNVASADPVATEMEHLMTEGEDLLRQLRPFIAKPHSPTITRA